MLITENLPHTLKDAASELRNNNKSIYWNGMWDQVITHSGHRKYSQPVRCYSLWVVDPLNTKPEPQIYTFSPCTGEAGEEPCS